MTIEKILVPVGAVLGVGELCVEAHDRREELSHEENRKTSDQIEIWSS